MNKYESSPDENELLPNLLNLRNKEKIEKQAMYLAFYNELFLNGQRDIGNGNEVEIFDRNRTYLGLGYGITDQLRIQAGWMKQITDNWSKNQLQLSLHHRIF